MTSLAGFTDLTESDLRRTFGAFPTGVVAILGEVDGEIEALTVSSFAAVSLDPPLVGFFAADSSSTWPKLRRAPSLGISILAEHHGGLARQLAGPATARLEGVSVREDVGAYFVAGALARLRVTIEQESAAGDHAAVLLRVHYVGGPTDSPPLVYHRSAFHQLGSTR